MDNSNLTSSTNESSTVQNAEIFRISKASLESSSYKINSVEIPIIEPANDKEHDSYADNSNATLTDDCNIYLKELVEDYVESSSVILSDSWF